LQLTPLRGHKIGAILCASISYNHISIYQGGAAEWQAVGRQFTSIYYARSPYSSHDRIAKLSRMFRQLP
jgi:hypothetical protein